MRGRKPSSSCACLRPGMVGCALPAVGTIRLRNRHPLNRTRRLLHGVTALRNAAARCASPTNWRPLCCKVCSSGGQPGRHVRRECPHGARRVVRLCRPDPMLRCDARAPRRLVARCRRSSGTPPRPGHGRKRSVWKLGNLSGGKRRCVAAAATAADMQRPTTVSSQERMQSRRQTAPLCSSASGQRGRRPFTQHSRSARPLRHTGRHLNRGAVPCH